MYFCYFSWLKSNVSIYPLNLIFSVLNYKNLKFYERLKIIFALYKLSKLDNHKSKISLESWLKKNNNNITNNKNYKLKNVIKKFDIPGLKKETVKFLDWFSKYNLVCDFGNNEHCGTKKLSKGINEYFIFCLNFSLCL